MSIQDLLYSPWTPLVFALGCICYGIYMIMKKDPSKASKRVDTSSIKEPERFAILAGSLFVFMGIGCVVMALLIKLNIDNMIITVQSLVWFIVFAVLWKIILNKYANNK